MTAIASFGAPNMEEEVRLLREQNALLQQQVQKQGTALDTLTQKVRQLESASTAHAVAEGENVPTGKTGFDLGGVHISAEGGVAFFRTGRDGFAPHSEFRVDEARVFFEAPVWEDVYFFGSLDLATRENTGLNAQVGELYLDFENVSKWLGKNNWLSLRAGRLNCPFGEEYLHRYAMENPLISHSLADFWGIDPGVEAYGKIGKFSYVLAVQNGSVSGVQDFTSDKAVTARVSYDPNAHWHFSVSAMRTGDLDAKNDFLSAIWFGNGWFRSIGSDSTTKFHADAVQGDVSYRWQTGKVSANGGYVHYGDNDPTGNNGRDIYYYAVEAQQELPRNFYMATRFSQIFAPNGYPIVGFGNFDKYFYGDLTTGIWRWSIGGGYRFSHRLAVKTEFSLEQARQASGSSRGMENFVGTEAVFKF